MRTWIARVVGSFDLARRDRELADELSAHLQLHIDDRVRAGMTPLEARRDALRRLGGVEATKESSRYVRGFLLLDRFRQDVQYALRALRKTSLSTSIAVLSLALAIGAVTAVYSTADWLLNRSTGAVLEPSQVVIMRTSDRNHPEIQEVSFSFEQYEDLRSVQDAFVDVAAFGKWVGVVADDARADQVVYEFVTGNYFSLLGVQPALGRTFFQADDVDGAPPVVILAYDFWQSRFGGDPNILDTLIRVEGQRCRVIGVAPKAFEGYHLDWDGPTRLWIPMHAGRTLGRSALFLTRGILFPIIGRLNPGSSIEVARQKAQGWLPSLRPALPIGPFKPTTIVLARSVDRRVRGRGPLQDLFGILLMVCALVLGAACSNVANFLLAQAVSRRGELALRIALGASRARVLQQLLTEALLLGLFAGGLGFAVGVVLVHALSSVLRVFLPQVVTNAAIDTALTVDYRMMGVALAIGIGCALVFGLLPALVASFRDPLTDLKNPRPSWSWGHVRITLRQVVLVQQVALSVVLAVAAGLYVRSLIRIAAVSGPYAHPESLMVARIVPRAVVDEPGSVLYRELVRHITAIPGVTAVGIAGHPPFSMALAFFSVPGHQDVFVRGAAETAAHNLFTALGVPITAGRDFLDSDDDRHNAVIVNSVLAERLWPVESPLGQLMTVFNEQRHVVGMVTLDRCADPLSEPMACAWTPFSMDQAAGNVYVRTAVAPTTVASSIKQIVHDLDRDVAVPEEAVVSDVVRDLTASQRTTAFGTMAMASFGMVLMAFGCISLFLAMVTDSLREIAIRMALGSSRGSLTRRIALQGLMLMIAGVVLGLIAARFVALKLADQLYRTSPRDSVTLTTVAGLIVSIGMLAVWYSATVATRTEPAQYLRAD